MHLQSSMHPLQCRRTGKEEARKLKWQPIPNLCVLLCLQAQDSGETPDLSASPRLAFPSGLASSSLHLSSLCPWFSHHKASDLRNSYTAVLWKMVFRLPSWTFLQSVALVFAKGSHLMSFLVSPAKSSVNSSVWSGLFLKAFSSFWPL